MTALRDLLEVYGALDEAAAQSGNPSVAATLDGFLPKASANTGWYREVENFFFREKAKRTPNLGEACARLGERAEQADQQKDARGGLTAPQKQRLFYGLSAAARIHQVAPTPMLASSDSELKAALVPALAAVGPKGKTYKERHEHAEAHFDDYFDAVRSRLTGPADYERFRKVAASSEMVDSATLNVPMCKSAIVTVDGLRCAVIDTVLSSDDISLNNLQAVVNPFNWNQNYPDFFIRMAPFSEPFRSDRWRRVLETVGFSGLGGYEITTALKYYPTLSEGEARLDYDLDDPTPGPGDGQVLVDRGYINMRVTNPRRNPAEGGVAVRTRKVIHISGLSPFAQQRLVCLTGYGTASSEFLFGPASDPRDKARGFDYYKHGQRPEEEPDISASEPPAHVVATAVSLLTDAVEGMTNDYFDMAEKWMAGGLRLSDITEYSQRVTGRLVASPFEFLERNNKPRYPRGRPNQPQQGGAQ
jgi:hypothetical protein